jgi:hypothetical protein
MKTDPMDAPPVQDVWVVFCDAPRVPLLRFLRPKFRHCFMILRGPHVWISVDPLLRGLEIMGHSVRAHPNLPQLLKDQGLTVVRTKNFAGGQVAVLPALFTCVTVVKRVLGLSAPGVFTPYQLYRRLMRDGAVPLLSTLSTISTDLSHQQKGKNNVFK